MPQNTERTGFVDAKATIAIFASTMAIVLALIYYVARIGFEQYPLLIGQTVALSVLFVCLPTTYLLLAPRLGIVPGTTWLTSDITIGIGTLSLVLLTGMLPASIREYVLLVWTVGGIFCYGFVLGSWWKQGNIWINSLFLGATMLFTVWIACQWMEMGYQNPLFEEKMAVAPVHIDTLYHASISSMIQTYNVPSTGLDGIPYLPYHTGSHWFVAQLSNLLNTYPLRLYQLGFPVILYPLFFFSILSFSIDLRRYIAHTETVWNVRRDGIFWLILLSAYIGIIPLHIRKEAAIFDSNLVSESYVVGLIWLFICFSLCVTFFRTTHNRLPQLRLQDMLFLGFLPLSLSILGFLKVSIMFLLFVVYGYIFLRFRLYTYWQFVISFLFMIVSVIVTYSIVHYPENSSGLVPFHFIRNYVAHASLSLFLVIHFLFSWIFIVWRLHTVRIRTVWDLKEAWRHKTMLDSEILALLCVFGIAPGLILAIPGGSAGYFSDVQRWVALSFLLAYEYNWIQTKKPLQNIRQSRNLWRIELKHIALAGFGIVLLVSLITDAIPSVQNTIKKNIALRSTVLGIEGSVMTNAIKHLDIGAMATFMTAPYEKHLAQNETYQVISTLRKLGQIPPSSKHETLVHIPKTNTRYWSMSESDCWLTPFFAPMLSGLASIHGLPSQDSCIPDSLTYGYVVYPQPIDVDQGVYSCEELCTQALKIGFWHIIVFTDEQKSSHIAHCPCQ